MRARFAPLVFAVLSGACGGNVVFVDDGSGGGGLISTGSVVSTVGPSSSVTTGSVTTGSSCDVLEDFYDDALRAAQSCDPKINSVQCDGSAILNDTCGCPRWVANEREPELYEAALAAYADWVSAGCGPLECGQDCPPAFGGFCQSGPNGSGFCAAYGPD